MADGPRFTIAADQPDGQTTIVTCSADEVRKRLADLAATIGCLDVLQVPEIIEVRRIA